MQRRDIYAIIMLYKALLKAQINAIKSYINISIY